jgi:hypothetical protein
MKTNYSDARRELIGSLNHGKTLSPETLAKMSKAALNRIRNKEEMDKLISLFSKPVTLFNLNGSIHSQYSGVRMMAKHFKCCHKTINKAIKANSVFRNIGYIRYTNK